MPITPTSTPALGGPSAPEVRAESAAGPRRAGRGLANALHALSVPLAALRTRFPQVRSERQPTEVVPATAGALSSIPPGFVPTPLPVAEPVAAARKPRWRMVATALVVGAAAAILVMLASRQMLPVALASANETNALRLGYGSSSVVVTGPVADFAWEFSSVVGAIPVWVAQDWAARDQHPLATFWRQVQVEVFELVGQPQSARSRVKLLPEAAQAYRAQFGHAIDEDLEENAEEIERWLVNWRAAYVRGEPWARGMVDTN
jgi:hypothetical protein